MPRPRSRRTYRRGLIDGTPSHVSGPKHRADPGPQRADVRCPVCSAGPRWPCEEWNKKRRKYVPLKKIHDERATLDREHKRARRAAKQAAERSTLCPPNTWTPTDTTTEPAPTTPNTRTSPN